MIVDCHMHAWRYPQHFNREAMLANQPLRRREWPDEKFQAMWDNPVERYLKVMGEVGKAVILGLNSRDTYGVHTPNEYLAAEARKDARLAWCCCVVPTEDGAADAVERCVKELGAVGVGELGPAYGNYFANDERCYPVYEVCQHLDVPIVIHAGPSQPRRLRMKYADVTAIDDVAIDFPRLKIVICHMGYYRYEDASFLVSKHENVFADMSWLASLSGIERSAIPRYLPTVVQPFMHFVYPLVYHLGQTFGDTDKILWGTDWSASPPRECIEALRGINAHLRRMSWPEIPERTLENILHENWKKVFRFDRERGRAKT